MLKLMSLEIRKHKLTGLIKGVLIANLIILGFMVLVLFVDQNEQVSTFTSFGDVFEGLFVFVKAVFIIFASALLGRLVIEEYRSNTISLLFMYPIPRKKLLTAKLIIVFLFTFCTIIISDLVLGALLFWINHFLQIIPGQLTWILVKDELVKLGTGALYAAGIGLIPLYFGMRKKSISATIISSVVLVTLISGGFDQARLGNFAAISISLGLIGIAIAYVSIRKIETDDIT
ncbi:ABC transporter permease [Paenibacillus agri]|uniref:ABC transporter permease n=1 Tax=Paenibacillus agri TaxID=2744309 RepID=A0A850ESD6_9BACL|nr:ABC transporter permease [Paenibacillus agri]NUU63795.1 ABC transporter permease [Paenibacillus agri]